MVCTCPGSDYIGDLSLDLPGTPSTPSDELHDLSFIVNVGSIALAIALLTVSFGSEICWSSYRRTSIILLALIALVFVLQFLTLYKGAPYGLANRSLSRWALHG